MEQERDVRFERRVSEAGCVALECLRAHWTGEKAVLGKDPLNSSPSFPGQASQVPEEDRDGDSFEKQKGFDALGSRRDVVECSWTEIK